MANYVFKGLRLTCADDVRQALAALFVCAAEPVDSVSLQLHVASLGELKQLIRETTLTDFRAFGWSRHVTLDDRLDLLIRNAARADLKWSCSAISLSDHFELPWYNWDGTNATKAIINYSEKFSTPLTATQEKPSPEVIRQLNEVEGVDTSLFGGITATSSWEEHQRTHSYSLVVPVATGATLFRAIVQNFRAVGLVGSWELRGNADSLQQLKKTTGLNQENYPDSCYPQGLGAKSYGFAVQADWLTPVLNCRFDKAMQVVSTVLGAGFSCRMSLKRTFIGWKRKDDTIGPRTQGNSFQLIYEREKFTLLVSVEQFSDADPPVTEFSPHFRKVASKFGAELKAA